MTKIGLYDIANSTTPESNKSQSRYDAWPASVSDRPCGVAFLET
jgi:hypothetical protein